GGGEDVGRGVVGGKGGLGVDRGRAGPGGVVLDVAGLIVAADDGSLPVNGLSFDVRAGEILGIAGVQGNGQTELSEALLGLRPAVAGSVTLNGRDLTHAAPRTKLRAGVACVAEDRREGGMMRS